MIKHKQNHKINLPIDSFSKASTDLMQCSNMSVMLSTTNATAFLQKSTNVKLQLTTAMEWLVVSTIQAPSPASVGKATLVMGCHVTLWVSLTLC